VGHHATLVCAEAEWWAALASIKGLVSFSFWNPDRTAQFTPDQQKVIHQGLALVTATPHCRLHSVQLCDQQVFPDETVRLLCQATTIRSLSFHFVQMSLECLAELARALPELESLEIIYCPTLHSSEGLIAICQNFPRLRSLSYRLPSANLNRSGVLRPSEVSNAAWIQLSQLRSLTFLHLSGYSLIADEVMQEWCRRGIEGGKQQMIKHQDTLKKFAGMEEMEEMKGEDLQGKTEGEEGSASSSSSSSVLSAAASSLSGISFQEIRFSGWMISYEQARMLLRSLPQLQLLSVHLLQGSKGSFTPPQRFVPRLLFAGGDYMQRQIASYISSGDSEQEIFK
jgi:hypothetical protein